MSAGVIPAATAAGTGLASLLGLHSADAAQQAAMNRYNTAAGRVSDFATNTLVPRGTGLANFGQQGVNQAAGYYSALLGRGGRSAMQAAVAPAAANISENYAGAERAIAPGDRSGTASMQRAELERQKVGQIARLTAGQQAPAAAALTNIGQTATSQGLGALEGAGSLYGSLVGPAAGLAGQANTQAAQSREGIGAGAGGILQLLASRIGSAKPKSGPA
jgi:hypothetical protein